MVIPNSMMNLKHFSKNHFFQSVLNGLFFAVYLTLIKYFFSYVLSYFRNLFVYFDENGDGKK